MLLRALQDVHDPVGVADRPQHAVRRTRLQREARAWFRSSEAKWPFAFIPICDVLGLDVEAVRAEACRRAHAADKLRVVPVALAESGPIVEVDVTEELTCQGCGQSFTNERERGRPPLRCPDCKSKPAEVKPATPKKKAAAKSGARDFGDGPYAKAIAELIERREKIDAAIKMLEELS